ncbi:DMT family transporter [Humibacillus sp. DSM 29435]|uniref:EamA family transporter n=1 Tax=Humibacillus sp. DSM 29435 TaxID=1869167 RepID=UPI0009F57C80|nr:EamA family transporter [Humibacillus sp. DSM 29435]
MKTVDAVTHHSPEGGPPLSADTATARQRGTGMAMMLASSASNQAGAGLGASAFPTIGPVGVVAVRQLVTALVLTPIVRPRLRGLTRAQWLPILGLVLVFSVMNLSLYAAIERIGLGLAVTLEFLGPLTVAVASSRRVRDLLCALMAGVGVVVLADPGPTTDIIGLSLGLVAAAAWACYILLNRTVGQRLPGLQGTATASLVAAAIWTPIALVWFSLHPPTAASIGLAVACGLLSSMVPYVADLMALRRVTATVFGTFTGINPVWAALAGWLLLQQTLHLNEWCGMALIVVSNILVTAGHRTSRPHISALATSSAVRLSGGEAGDRLDDTLR